jgi:hypothetical protein
MDPRLRAADTDREHVADLLQRHTTAGRLTLDEYEQRVTAAWHASTLGELAALTTDLPDAQLHRRTDRLPMTPVLAALTALVLLVVLAGLLAATSAAGWAHMGSMMATMGSMTGCH